MKQGLFAALLTLPLLTANSAWALFDAQVLTGKRNTDFKSSGSNASKEGSELKIAAHLDPIPLVPIGFGVSLAQTTWGESEALGSKAIDGLELGLEVEAWLPMQLAGFEPYAKLGYTAAGAYAVTSESGLGEFKTTYKPSGVYLAAGLRYNILLRLGVMLEIEQSTRKIAFDTFKDLPAGIDAVGKAPDMTASSRSILLGVRAGL